MIIMHFCRYKKVYKLHSFWLAIIFYRVILDLMIKKKQPKREPQICSKRNGTDFWAGNTLSGVSRKHFKKLIGCKFVTDWKKLLLEMYTGYYVFIKISLHTEWELLSLLFHWFSILFTEMSFMIFMNVVVNNFFCLVFSHFHLPWK